MTTKLSKYLFISLAISVFLATAHAGWNPFDNKSKKEPEVKESEIAKTIAAFKNKDSKMSTFFNKAYGYAVFPTVDKGAIAIGGAYGRGKVYEAGKLIGRSKLTQVSIGLQLGGQSYSEIIFFKDKNAMNDFKSGEYKLGAQASAVAVTSGASADADYSDGVAIFTLAKTGLMFEAAVGGQKFSFSPY